MPQRSRAPGQAISRGGKTATARGGTATAPPRGGRTAVARPGAETLPGRTYGEREVTDPQLLARIQQAVPGLLAQAPDFLAQAHQSSQNGHVRQGMPEALQNRWLNAQLEQAGILQDNLHLTQDGRLIRDSTFWEDWKWPILIGGGVASLGFLPGGAFAGLFGGGGAGGAAGGMWNVGPTTAANFAATDAAVTAAGGAGAGAAGAGTLAGVSAGMPAALPGAVGSIPGLAGGGLAAGGAAGGAATGAAAGAASKVPSWLGTIAKVAAPIVGGALANRSSGQQDVNPGAMDPELLAQMKHLLGLSTQRIERQTPVHEAAMRLAQSMAPTGAHSPRMAQAIQQTGQSQGQPMNPNVLAAIHALRGGR